MREPLTHDTTADGFVFFKGPLKIATVTTRYDAGVVEKGVIKMQPLPRSGWTIHFTSPQMPIELVEKIVAALPKTDGIYTTELTTAE